MAKPIYAARLLERKFDAPIIAGSGTPCLPCKFPVKLELLDERRFANGMIHVRYRAKS